MAWRWSAGLLLRLAEAGLWIVDPHHLDGRPTHGPDSDATAQLAALLLAWVDGGASTPASISLHGSAASEVAPHVLMGVLWPPASHPTVATGETDDEQAIDLRGEGADLVAVVEAGWSWLGLDLPAEDAPPAVPDDLQRAVTADAVEAWAQAWALESAPTHVSQGAYVSDQTYHASLAARLGPWAPSTTATASEYPPREHLAPAHDGWTRLPDEAEVVSWTRLIGAGAPSEFALRAELVGGLRTALVEWAPRIRGVVLMTDDTDADPVIGGTVRFAVRRLYAMEGELRHGLKAWLAPASVIATPSDT